MRLDSNCDAARIDARMFASLCTLRESKSRNNLGYQCHVLFGGNVFSSTDVVVSESDGGQRGRRGRASRYDARHPKLQQPSYSRQYNRTLLAQAPYDGHGIHERFFFLWHRQKSKQPSYDQVSVYILHLRFELLRCAEETCHAISTLSVFSTGVYRPIF